jgi:hypothetical protein
LLIKDIIKHIMAILLIDLHFLGWCCPEPFVVL